MYHYEYHFLQHTRNVSLLDQNRFFEAYPFVFLELRHLELLLQIESEFLFLAYF
jgi:hypothetical protein